MKEADLSAKIVKELRKRDAWAQKIHGSAYQTKGLPDILGVHNTVAFGIETKLPGKESTLTLLQRKTLIDMRKAGGVAIMATTVEQALDVLRLCESVAGGLTIIQPGIPESG